MPGFWSQLGGFGNTDFAYLMSLTSDFTLQDVNTVQKAFNVGTASGGAITLTQGAWEFDGQYIITNTGTTAHTWSILLGGTATIGAGSMCIASGLSAGAAAPTAGGLQGWTNTPGTAMVVTASSTSATENVTVFLNGRLNVTAAGTIIPQLQLSAATTGTELMKAGSVFRVWLIGPTTTTTVGAVA